MAKFPRLKTGAVTQYPGERRIRFSNERLRFVDGGMQLYRNFNAPLRTWGIELSELDESEMNLLEKFFRELGGRFESFPFTDPADGVVYPDCSLSSDQLQLVYEYEQRGTVKLVVRENRSGR